MNDAALRPVHLLPVLGGLLLFFVATVATAGHPVAALLPGALILGGLFLWFAPTWVLTALFFFVLLVVDNPRERPHMGVWKTPFYHVGSIFYDTLQKHGLVLKFFGVELLLVGLAFLMFARWLARPPTGEGNPVPREFRLACVVAAFVILFWVVWGIVQGGSLPRALLQFRPMLFCAITPLIYTASIRERRHISWAITGILVAGVIRATLAIVFWFFVIRTGQRGALGGGNGSYASMHSDTFIFTTCLCVLLFALVHRRPKPIVFVAPVLIPWFTFAIFANNRRLAYIVIALTFVVFFFICDSWIRKRIYLMAAAALPVALLYLAVGWNSGAGWATPVQSVKSLFSQEDSSSESRDIENYNLIYTASRKPVLGSGFGHPYIEKKSAVDLSNIFEVFRYLPHNNILWFLGTAGVIGYTLYLGFVLTALFMAMRLYIFVDEPLERTVALATVTVICCYMMQGYGDMGFWSWSGTMLMAQLMGMTGVLYGNNREALA